MNKKDEKEFTESFLNSLTPIELVILQHDLRRFPEDKKYLEQVLEEIRKREIKP